MFFEFMRIVIRNLVLVFKIWNKEKLKKHYLIFQNDYTAN